MITIHTWVGRALHNAKRAILILIYVNKFKKTTVPVFVITHMD